MRLLLDLAITLKQVLVVARFQRDERLDPFGIASMLLGTALRDPMALQPRHENGHQKYNISTLNFTTQE